jgi:hypothetical protein
MERISPTNDRPVYPEYRALMRAGDKALSVAELKSILGWEEEPIGDNWGNDYLFVDRQGKKIRCSFLTKNKPLYQTTLDDLEQEHLNNRWRVNGEPIILSRYGNVLNGQHTMISAVLAEQTRTGPQKDHWAQFWAGPVTLQKLLVCGIAEDQETINTIDTGRRRSMADMLYHNGNFSEDNSDARRLLSKLTAQAIRLIWDRTGYSEDPFAPRQKRAYTHTEIASYLDRHLRIIEAARHIALVNRGSRLGALISPGYATGLLYLMGASSSDGSRYRQENPVTQESLTWNHWDKACEFWRGIADPLIGRSVSWQTVRKAVAGLVDPNSGEDACLRDRAAVFCLAWQFFVAGSEPTADDLSLEKYYTIDPEGIRVAHNLPVLGGIDLGDPSSRYVAPEPEDPKELEERAREVRRITQILMERREKRLEPETPSTVAKPGEGKPPPPALKSTCNGDTGTSSAVPVQED